MQLAPGAKVAARGLEWEVVAVDDLGAQSRLRLVCSSGDLAGLEWDLLHPLEPIAELRSDPDPRAAGSLEDWRRYHTAWLLDQVPGPGAQPGRLAVEAYQRVPLLRALGMVRPRLLLADGVGLGKTVQAGLIAAELLVRRRAHRVLVVTPPGPLLRQWSQEMKVRFGLRFTVIADGAGLRQARHGLEAGANVWESVALCLTSLDFAKSDRVLAELERVQWDLVIIDEAHHCAAEDSQRRTLAEVLARRSDGLLFLTATPHDGHDPHFAALMGLLDPSLVDATGALIGTAYRRHVVRRLKQHVRDPVTGRPLFRPRVVQPVGVDAAGSAAVADFHRALSALVAPRLRRSADRAGLADALAFVSLLKRSLSTVAACVATLRVVAARYGEADTAALRRERLQALRRYRRRVERYGVLGAGEEGDLAALEAEEMAAGLTEATLAELLALIALGERAAADDPKLAALWREIRLIRLERPGANVLVYTEYAESQRAAAAALAGIGGTVLTIGGSDSEADRAAAAERCGFEDGIVLVSTDSLAEGLNLHRRCCHLIHLDLPYNPNRLEQRNGRIDRYGQVEDPQIRYLYLLGTFEERLLLRLIAKYEKARECLAVMPDTLGVTAPGGGLREGLFREDLFSPLPRLVHSLDLAGEDEASEAYRDLLREIDRAFQGFDHMAVRHGWLSGGEADAGGGAVAADIDVAGFVAGALPDRVVPEAWAAELQGLSGVDGRRVRLTTDPAGAADALYPGRAHPLTRRVVAAARTGHAGRVSAAVGALSLVATFAVETSGVLLRRVFALRAWPDQRIEDARDWMDFHEPAEADWGQRFAPWVPLAALRRHAQATGAVLAEAFSAEHRQRLARDDATVLAWLERRADDLCGRRRAVTPDLFGGAAGPDWRALADPAARLDAFAADATQPAAARYEAADALARVRERVRPVPSAPRVRALGLLMLVP
jgi:hypothetical protein